MTPAIQILSLLPGGAGASQPSPIWLGATHWPTTLDRQAGPHR
jgi:hypothetical protein